MLLATAHTKMKMVAIGLWGELTMFSRSGHNLGTIELVNLSNQKVAEAAVVGKPHEVKGESIFAFVVTKGDRPVGDDEKMRSPERMGQRTGRRNSKAR